MKITDPARQFIEGVLKEQGAENIRVFFAGLG